MKINPKITECGSQEVSVYGSVMFEKVLYILTVCWSGCKDRSIQEGDGKVFRTVGDA